MSDQADYDNWPLGEILRAVASDANEQIAAALIECIPIVRLFVLTNAYRAELRTLFLMVHPNGDADDYLDGVEAQAIVAATEAATEGVA